MALVRRSELIAPATAQPPGAAGATAAVGTIPRPGQPAEPGQYPPPPGPPSTGAEVAAVPSRPAGAGWVLLALLLVAIGAGVAYVLDRTGMKADPFKIGNQTSVYAGLAVFAAALERIIETFAQWLPGGQKVKAEYEQMVAAAANAHPTVTLADVAKAKARLDHSQANRTVLIWGLACAVATGIAMLSGFCLLHMIAGDTWNPRSIPFWVDALVTGVVVGTGTKPLHDLITKAQNAREAAAGK
jgi:hypothetical protein